VTLLYARDEKLWFANGYRGILALTPTGQSRAVSLAPRARTAHISWGVDLRYFPLLDYRPQWFLSCGKTRRDFPTLAKAAALDQAAQVRIINVEPPAGIQWPKNVELLTGIDDGKWQTVSYGSLFEKHYGSCAAALVVVQSDPGERFAVGFTQLLEAMALGRPVIATRTGALPGEIDVEKEGCGIWVPANDPDALAKAMEEIRTDPVRAEKMGRAGRRLCEERYNMDRYAVDLHRFFETL
jgi:hypothetical protein